MHSPLKPKKSLGQNFLTDVGIVARIVGSLQVPNETPVVEIGPGTGVMTGLLQRQYPTFKVVELDDRAVKLLAGTFPGLDIHHGDVLDPAWFGSGSEPMAVIGNIPYYITSPILFLLIDHKDRFRQAVLMVQKEVGERLAAQPGTKAYGILSVQAQLAAQVELLFTVPRTAFHPVPNVDSAVVRLTFDKPTPDVDAQFLRRVIRMAFSQRRKMLRNTLAPLLEGRDLPGWDLSRRAETLSLDEFVTLAKTLR